jgi:Zn-finger nucleic acid-binding protein
MICPACDHPLKPLQVGQLTVDVCDSGCGGIWFDNFELKRVDEPTEWEGEALLDVRFDPEIQVDHDRRRTCPKCSGVVLLRHFFSQQRRVQIDTCPSCGGVWLDAGELAMIRRENATKEDRKAAAQKYFTHLFQQDFARLRAGEHGPGPPPA